MKILFLVVLLFFFSFSYGLLEIDVQHANQKCQRVKNGDRVHLHIVGSLDDGKRFLESTSRPYSFKVGTNEGIKN
jgi:FKBP-type peptidyl-prolyl cis-trans isomerase